MLLSAEILAHGEETESELSTEDTAHLHFLSHLS